MATTDNDTHRAEDEALARDREQAEAEAEAEAREDRAEEPADEQAATTAETKAAVEAPRDGITEARRRFGGLDVPATFVGMLAALAFATIAAGIAVAVTDEAGYDTGLKSAATDPSYGGLAGGIAIVLVSFLVGGWAAARMARYDGLKNGLVTAIWALVLAAVVGGLAAGLGDDYETLANFDLPEWFGEEAVATEAIVGSAGAIVATLLGGALGGLLGTRFHRKVDAAIVQVERAREEQPAVEEPAAVR